MVVSVSQFTVFGIFKLFQVFWEMGGCWYPPPIKKTDRHDITEISWKTAWSIHYHYSFKIARRTIYL